MLRLDHLVIVAPSLAEGEAHVRACLGLPMQAGGRHPEMGTHNLVLRLGDDVYLEVIAVDPAAPAPSGPRWFGLDEAVAVRTAWDNGRRLRAWVARTDAIGAVVARTDSLGGPVRVSRGTRSWLFSLRPDGALPVGGIAPSVIDWEGQPGPASGMTDVGARLLSFTVAHPEPERVTALYARLGIADPPAITAGPELTYGALVRTPAGERSLF
ncbi:VOC family protein [Methylobacterium sp. ID0610]